jgi:hypothetical protein
MPEFPENPKSETGNSKQIQMTKKENSKPILAAMEF